MAEESYYELLQVTPTADLEIITGAYRALILRHHPDRNPSPIAEATTKRLNEAWEVLSDPAKRAEYDRELAAGPSSRPAPPPRPPNRPPQETPPPRALHGSGFLGWWEDWGVAASIMLAILLVIFVAVLILGLATS